MLTDLFRVTFVEHLVYSPPRWEECVNHTRVCGKTTTRGGTSEGRGLSLGLRELDSESIRLNKRVDSNVPGILYTCGMRSGDLHHKEMIFFSSFL